MKPKCWHKTLLFCSHALCNKKKKLKLWQIRASFCRENHNLTNVPFFAFETKHLQQKGRQAVSDCLSFSWGAERAKNYLKLKWKLHNYSSTLMAKGRKKLTPATPSRSSSAQQQLDTTATKTTSRSVCRTQAGNTKKGHTLTLVKHDWQDMRAVKEISWHLPALREGEQRQSVRQLAGCSAGTNSCKSLLTSTFLLSELLKSHVTFCTLHTEHLSGCCALNLLAKKIYISNQFQLVFLSWKEGN